MKCGKRTDEFLIPLDRILNQRVSFISEMRRSRHECISAFKASLLDADVFVFTLGLTESWFNLRSKTEYPMCSGTIVGDFNSNNMRSKIKATLVYTKT